MVVAIVVGMLVVVVVVVVVILVVSPGQCDESISLRLSWSGVVPTAVAN